MPAKLTTQKYTVYINIGQNSSFSIYYRHLRINTFQSKIKINSRYFRIYNNINYTYFTCKHKHTGLNLKSILFNYLFSTEPVTIRFGDYFILKGNAVLYFSCLEKKCRTVVNQ